MDNLPKTEGLTVEFKTDFREEAAETLVAFSNAKGGTLYIGVSDSGKVVGMTLGQETVQKWINEVKNKTRPQIIPDVEVITVKGKTVAALSVIEYPVKPVSIRGKYLKRIGSSNHVLGIDEITNEHLKTINSSWDFYVDPNHSLDDLSAEKIARFADKIRQSESIGQIGLSDVDLLNKLEFLRGGRVTFGAYLLFAKTYCAISDVQAGRFKGDTVIIDSISFDTDLFQEVEGLIAFIKKHLMVKYIITGEPQRTERFDYPLDAIREIVVNMVVHRDYRDSSASVVKIFDNRIEFYNPGKLYGGITVQDLLSGKYTSKSRNKLIAKAFKEAEIIERYGSGIMRVRKICKEYGVKEPEFTEIADGFQVILYNERVDVGVNGENVGVNGENVGVNEENVGVNDENVGVNGKNVGVNNMDAILLDELLEKIFVLLKNDAAITYKQMAKKLNINEKTVERSIKRLKELGFVERVGSDKSGSWKITYNLNNGDRKI